MFGRWNNLLHNNVEMCQQILPREAQRGATPKLRQRDSFVAAAHARFLMCVYELILESTIRRLYSPGRCLFIKDISIETERHRRSRVETHGRVTSAAAAFHVHGLLRENMVEPAGLARLKLNMFMLHLHTAVSVWYGALLRPENNVPTCVFRAPDLHASAKRLGP